MVRGRTAFLYRSGGGQRVAFFFSLISATGASSLSTAVDSGIPIPLGIIARRSSLRGYCTARCSFVSPPPNRPERALLSFPPGIWKTNSLAREGLTEMGTMQRNAR